MFFRRKKMVSFLGAGQRILVKPKYIDTRFIYPQKNVLFFAV